MSTNPLVLSEVFDFQGQAVRWGRIGNQGPAVVMVHGTPFSSYVWRRIAPLLADQYQVYFYDLLGYGQSEQKEGQDVSLGIQNELLASLIKHWELERPHVVAHDFGGATALRAHLLNKIEYASLSLIDPVAIAPWGTPLIKHVRHHEQAFSGAPKYVHEAILTAYIQGSTYRPIHDEDFQAYVKPWTGEVGQAAFYRQIVQMDEKYTDVIEQRYAEISCPVLLLWGEQDHWIAVEHGDEIARRIPGVKYVRVPDAGHLVQEEAPEVIVGHVMNFIRS